MHTIAAHAVPATVLAAGHIGYLRLMAASRTVGSASGATGLAVILFVAFMAAVGSAIRRLSDVMARLLGMVAAAMSVVLALVAGLALAVVLLIHHL